MNCRTDTELNLLYIKTASLIIRRCRFYFHRTNEPVIKYQASDRYFPVLSRRISRSCKSGSESIAFNTSLAKSSTISCHSTVPTGRSAGDAFPCALRIAPTLMLNARARRKVGSLRSSAGFISCSIDGLSATATKTLALFKGTDSRPSRQPPSCVVPLHSTKEAEHANTGNSIRRKL